MGWRNELARSKLIGEKVDKVVRERLGWLAEREQTNVGWAAWESRGGDARSGNAVGRISRQRGQKRRICGGSNKRIGVEAKNRRATEQFLDGSGAERAAGPEETEEVERTGPVCPAPRSCASTGSEGGWR